MEKFYLDKIEKNPANSWANYTKGVLLELQRAGVHFTGFNAAIHGTIPFGAGLSSSAALEMATAMTVRQLFPFSLTGASTNTAARVAEPAELNQKEKLALAKIGQAAESSFVGVNCGLLDQISSLFGKAGHVIEIDCLHNSVSHEPMPSGVSVIVADSGVKHALSDGDYNELRRQCESAAKKLGVEFLRFVNPAELEAAKDKLTLREYQCAYHIAGENQRVVFGARALREGDIAQFGQYLFQSHESSRDFFHNSAPELDQLVEIAREHPGCHGARLTGGGFGGATINLVRDSEAESFKEWVSIEYRKRAGREVSPWACQIVDGAH
jgi:galactokinase